MEGVVTKLFRKSDDLLEKMDCIQFNRAPLTTNDNNIFELYDDNKILEQDQFHHSLASQYSTTMRPFCQDSLDQALMNSLFDSTNPRPLAIYINDDRNVAVRMFSELNLCSESVINYLTKQFVVWSWNLTKENYHELLTMVATHAGVAVAAVIDSSPTDVYPLLICLIFDRGQIKVESVIQGMMSDNDAFALLIQAHDAFGARFELPNTTGLHLTNISTENWSIPASSVTQVSKESDEFRRVAADFDGGASLVVRIDRIENTIWLMQYLNEKEMVDARIGHDGTEKLLFHGCPYSAAEQILQQGFDHHRIGRNGSLFGHGFYFSASRQVSDRYALPNPTTGEKRILLCRVLVGRSCAGNSNMRTCPTKYDSTTDESNIHVIFSNRHVLPEYLITYK